MTGPKTEEVYSRLIGIALRMARMHSRKWQQDLAAFRRGADWDASHLHEKERFLQAVRELRAARDEERQGEGPSW